MAGKLCIKLTQLSHEYRIKFKLHLIANSTKTYETRKRNKLSPQCILLSSRRFEVLNTNALDIVGPASHTLYGFCDAYVPIGRCQPPKHVGYKLFVAGKIKFPIIMGTLPNLGVLK